MAFTVNLLVFGSLAVAAWISPWGFPWNLPVVVLAGAFGGYFAKDVVERIGQ